MPLTDFEHVGTHPETLGPMFRSRSASTGERVPVHISIEAIDDYGEQEAFRKASDKFDGGEVNERGIVTVKTSDFM